MNYFNIPNVDDVMCRVFKYTPHHSKLIIRGYNADTSQTIFWLTFIVPAYLKCPMIWKGANFRLADTHERIAFGQSTLFSNDVLREYQLFIAEVDQDLDQPNVVQILALDTQLTYEVTTS